MGGADYQTPIHVRLSSYCSLPAIEQRKVQLGVVQPCITMDTNDKCLTKRNIIFIINTVDLDSYIDGYVDGYGENSKHYVSKLWFV